MHMLMKCEPPIVFLTKGGSLFSRVGFAAKRINIAGFLTGGSLRRYYLIARA